MPTLQISQASAPLVKEIRWPRGREARRHGSDPSALAHQVDRFGEEGELLEKVLALFWWLSVGVWLLFRSRGLLATNLIDRFTTVPMRHIPATNDKISPACQALCGRRKAFCLFTADCTPQATDCPAATGCKASLRSPKVPRDTQSDKLSRAV